MSLVREWARLLRRTPIHPQWLLGRRKPPRGLDQATGVIMDIGAADRWISAHLPPATSYVALDYPATGNEFYGARPDIFADACSLPLADQCVDGVVCLEVIEHVPDPARAITEIARVLKPGGRAWVSMPFLYPLHNEPFDFQRYTEFGLRRDVSRASLEVVSLDRTGHAIRAAGLMMCLAIAGGVDARRGVSKTLLLPFALLAIVATNVLAWLMSIVWPDWKNIATGHHLELRKRAEPAASDGSTK
ncbi:class I SAM-dependent methyltransferase [Dyella lutea]|uniref:Methyltransferase domain-containing protein n=1 Tax=Dyella lutea TaxID=2950441 RepID=A0ABT1F7U3_9GAMM|nr:class I SAM-dependent methyltransferase [Dyella lutea]MCP1373433.1 methyltransferase domain-containing protein [Dyella lutea]